MDSQDLLRKLKQIEEQAQLTLDEFPRTLTKERQRMIIALVRHISANVRDAADAHSPVRAAS